MNKRILMSGISIVSALGLVAGTAFAMFSSQASNNGNTFGAGTLTLTVTPNGGTTSTPAFTVTNIAPGDVKIQAITLANTGSILASSVVLTNITHSGSLPDLGDKLNLEIWNDVDGSGTINPGDTLQGNAVITSGAWSNIPLGFGLNASGTHQIVAKVTFDPSSGDSFQGTTSSFNLNFQANQ